MRRLGFHVNRGIRRGLSLGGGILILIFLIKLASIELNALLAERTFMTQWRVDGGLKKFLHIASDLELTADSDELLAQYAADDLSEGGRCDENPERIMKFLESEKRPMIQFRLIRALGDCHSNQAVPILLGFLNDSDNELTCIGAAKSLGVLRAREAIPKLEGIVVHNASRCANNAAVALGRMGEKRVAYPWAVDALSAKRPLRDEGSRDYSRRQDAGEILGMIGTEADVPLLDENKDFLGVFRGYEEKAIRDREAIH